MRYFAIVFAMTLLTSCSSTKIIERDLSDSAVSEVNAMCADGCSSEVSYGRYIPVVESQADDSLYESLRRKDVALRLEDSRVVEGRVGRIADDPDEWLVYQVDESGTLIDSVHFRASSIESVRMSGQATAHRLHIDGGVLRLDAAHTMPMRTVSEITITENTERDRNQGAKNGFLFGAAFGGSVGLIGAVSMMRDCDPDKSRRRDSPWSMQFCEASLGAALGVAAIFALATTVFGGFIGAVGATKKVIYRFRPDTPQQMSVVIGVGPPATAHARME